MTDAKAKEIVLWVWKRRADYLAGLAKEIVITHMFDPWDRVTWKLDCLVEDHTIQSWRRDDFPYGFRLSLVLYNRPEAIHIRFSL